MHTGDITIDQITKVEGSAGLKVVIENDEVKDLKFMLQDYRRFYTQAVKGKPFIAASSFFYQEFAARVPLPIYLRPSKQLKFLRELKYQSKQKF